MLAAHTALLPRSVGRIRWRSGRCSSGRGLFDDDVAKAGAADDGAANRRERSSRRRAAKPFKCQRNAPRQAEHHRRTRLDFATCSAPAFASAGIGRKHDEGFQQTFRNILIRPGRTTGIGAACPLMHLLASDDAATTARLSATASPRQERRTPTHVVHAPGSSGSPLEGPHSRGQHTTPNRVASPPDPARKPAGVNASVA